MTCCSVSSAHTFASTGWRIVRAFARHEIWVLSPNHRLVTSEFLFQIVRMDRFIGAASTAYGTHMPRANWNVVKNYELAVPGT